jgi:hypothetical protein
LKERLAAARVAKVDAVISVRGLHKHYGAVEAVAGIDLEVGRGEIFAFLGPTVLARRRRWRSWRASARAAAAR